MNNILKTIKPYFPLIFGVLIIILLVSVVIIPGITNITDMKEEIQNSETTRTAYDQKINILADTNVTKLTEYLTNSVLAVPTTYNAPNLLNAVQNIGDASGVTFSGLQFSQAAVPVSGSGSSATAQATKYGEYTLSLTATADYAHIIALLKNFENTLPIFKISNVSLRSSGSASESLNLSFALTTFYQPLPTTLGKKDSPISDLTESEIKMLATLENYSNYPLVPNVSNIGKTNPFKQ